jgi:hypothetical protein
MASSKQYSDDDDNDRKKYYSNDYTITNVNQLLTVLQFTTPLLINYKDGNKNKTKNKIFTIKIRWSSTG